MESKDDFKEIDKIQVPIIDLEEIINNPEDLTKQKELIGYLKKYQACYVKHPLFTKSHYDKMVKQSLIYFKDVLESQKNGTLNERTDYRPDLGYQGFLPATRTLFFDDLSKEHQDLANNKEFVPELVDRFYYTKYFGEFQKQFDKSKDPKYADQQQVIPQDQQFNEIFSELIDIKQQVGLEIMKCFDRIFNTDTFFQDIIKECLIEAGSMLTDLSQYKPNQTTVNLHKDFGMITVHLKSNYNALCFVINDKKYRIDYPEIENDYFFIQVGECLENITNGLFKASHHEVILFADLFEEYKINRQKNIDDKDRYNISTFIYPNPYFEFKRFKPFLESVTGKEYFNGSCFDYMQKLYGKQIKELKNQK